MFLSITPVFCYSNIPIFLMAKELELKLKEGDQAPPFDVATSGGGRLSLADFKGKNVMRYF